MHVYNSQRNRRAISKRALLGPASVPWRQLLNFGDDNSFLVVTGFTRQAFVELERVIVAQEDIMIRAGRPPSLNVEAAVIAILLPSSPTSPSRPHRPPHPEIQIYRGTTGGTHNKYVLWHLGFVLFVTQLSAATRINFSSGVYCWFSDFQTFFDARAGHYCNLFEW